MELTELERQRAAEFTAAFWRQRYKRSRQLLTPVETILPAHAWALRVSEAFEASSNPFQYLRTYRSIDGGRSVDDRDIAGKSRLDVYAKEIAEAKAALLYFQIAGDNAKSTEQSVIKDRQIADMLAEQKMRNESFCIEKVAEAVKLSRPSTHERYKLRCERILKALHRDCPTIWADGAPVERKSPRTGRVWPEIPYCRIAKLNCGISAVEIAVPYHD
jgi:hypothetical protein